MFMNVVVLKICELFLYVYQINCHDIKYDPRQLYSHNSKMYDMDENKSKKVVTEIKL